MGSDSSSSFGGCPKAKKSKTSEEIAFTSYWAHLPSLLLHDIFDLLSKEDRKNASAVCKNWRQNVYHPKWWPTMTFKIEQNNIQKARFYIYTFAKIVREAKIVLNSLSLECMEEFVNLLELLSENDKLDSLIIEPTHCRFELPPRLVGRREDPWGMMSLLRPCLPKLSKFSIGCVEDLTYFHEDILNNLLPSKVTHLGLASVKDDPVKYEVSYFDPDMIIPFTKLQVLSIDYDQLSDQFLDNLQAARELERLVVHLHGVRENHPGTSNRAWFDFKEKHWRCEFRLTIIHAFKDIKQIHQTVMRQVMPLTHIKVFFCEGVNLELLQNLSSHYMETLRSIMWVDSISGNEDKVFIKPEFDESPDPFVLASWLCRNLQEIVLYGYRYKEENLVAIGRLRGHQLQTLEIAESDINFNCEPVIKDALLDIPRSLQKPWRPIPESELHPVICNPTDGDSDEYLLPIVLADLY